MKHKIQKVTWHDTATFTGWQKANKVLRPALCTTIGKLVRSDKDSITLAGSFDNEDGSFLDPITIPRGCIVKIRNIKIGKL